MIIGKSTLLVQIKFWTYANISFSYRCVVLPSWL